MYAAITQLKNSPGEHLIIKQALGEAVLRVSSTSVCHLDWLWHHLSPEGRRKLLTENGRQVDLSGLPDG